LKERGHVHPKNELDVKVMAAFVGGGSRTVSPSRPASPPKHLVPAALDQDFESLGSAPQ